MSEIQTEYKTAMTKEPVDLVSGKDRQERFMVILEAMLWGIEVELAGFTLRFAETKGGGFLPMVLSGENKDLVVGMEDMTITWISEYAAKMDEKAFKAIQVQLASSKALTSFKTRRAA